MFRAALSMKQTFSSLVRIGMPIAAEQAAA
jgi:hypothetical protein